MILWYITYDIICNISYFIDTNLFCSHITETSRTAALTNQWCNSDDIHLNIGINHLEINHLDISHLEINLLKINHLEQRQLNIVHESALILMKGQIFT